MASTALHTECRPSGTREAPPAPEALWEPAKRPFASATKHAGVGVLAQSQCAHQSQFQVAFVQFQIPKTPWNMDRTSEQVLPEHLAKDP